MSDITFTVFTKPWKLELAELAAYVKSLGFDGVELPVRPGYSVTPENVTTELPQAVKVLGEQGLKIASIAGPTDEKTFAACQEAGVPVIRICVGMREGEGYMAGEARLRREYEQMLPLLEKYGVTLGLQNHSGNRDVSSAMGLRHLMEGLPPKQIGAVWDAGHNGLEGEAPESAIDIIWPHLRMVNLKSAYWRVQSSPDAPQPTWKPYWTLGEVGRANWPRVVAELQKREYSGVVCLTAEYTDEDQVDRNIAHDIAYARSLFAA